MLNKKPLSACLKLGQNRAARLGIGSKAALLDKAARAGLSVPRGVIVPEEVWAAAETATLLHSTPRQLTLTDPYGLWAWLALPAFTAPVAVRSAFSAEDRVDESLAGFFHTELNVDAADPLAFSLALMQVLNSARGRSGLFRRDVLILEMVSANVAGVAFTEREFEDDNINFVTGLGHQLVAGDVPGTTLHLPKIHSGEGLVLPPDAPPGGWPGRLQKLLRAVRRVFGSGDWDVEWADDGTTCWLLQVRPITRPSRRNEAFTIANHKEILPELPSPFMTSLIASCADRLFAYYRRFDRSLPAQRPFIEVFYGRPFINLSLMTEMMRHFGLPTRLVTDSIGGEAGVVYGPNLPRLLRKIPALGQLGLAQLGAEASAGRTRAAMLRQTREPGDDFTGLVQTLQRLYTDLVTEMFSLTAAISGPTAVLRRLGVLAEHNARQESISSRIYTDLDELRAYVQTQPALHSVLQAGQLPDDERFQFLWRTYLHQHGHRGIYESDIARPRFHEAPAALLHSLTRPANPRPRPPRSLLAWMTLPLWWQAGRSMRARELLRYDAMRGFDRVRAALLRCAGQAVAAGQLPTTDDVWVLHIDEVCRLDQGWVADADFITHRRAELTELAGYHLPDLFHRFDNLAVFRDGPGSDNRSQTHFQGLGLTTGTIEGRAWVLSEPATRLPPDFDSGQTILVARSVDAGWIPTFAQVAGVVVETGGDLSHGSIILREMGLPAITNVQGVTRTLQTGDRLRLQAEQGHLQIYPSEF